MVYGYRLKLLFSLRFNGIISKYVSKLMLKYNVNVYVSLLCYAISRLTFQGMV
jgi:hypothetical protein